MIIFVLATLHDATLQQLYKTNILTVFRPYKCNMYVHDIYIYVLYVFFMIFYRVTLVS